MAHQTQMRADFVDELRPQFLVPSNFLSLSAQADERGTKESGARHLKEDGASQLDAAPPLNFLTPSTEARSRGSADASQKHSQDLQASRVDNNGSPPESLHTHLSELQNQLAETVFIARRIGRMNFQSQEILTNHYSQYGTVVRVLVTHSKVKPYRGYGTQPRVRPGNFGFVIMDSPESVARILSAGPEQVVAGHRIRVEQYQHMFKPFSDLDSGTEISMGRLSSSADVGRDIEGVLLSREKPRAPGVTDVLHHLSTSLRKLITLVEQAQESFSGTLCLEATTLSRITQEQLCVLQDMCQARIGELYEKASRKPKAQGADSRASTAATGTPESGSGSLGSNEGSGSTSSDQGSLEKMEEGSTGSDQGTREKIEEVSSPTEEENPEGGFVGRHYRQFAQHGEAWRTPGPSSKAAVMPMDESLDKLCMSLRTLISLAEKDAFTGDLCLEATALSRLAQGHLRVLQEHCHDRAESFKAQSQAHAHGAGGRQLRWLRGSQNQRAGQAALGARKLPGTPGDSGVAPSASSSTATTAFPESGSGSTGSDQVNGSSGSGGSTGSDQGKTEEGSTGSDQGAAKMEEAGSEDSQSAGTQSDNASSEENGQRVPGSQCTASPDL